MSYLDLAGHVAYALLILGQLRITHKYRDGFLLRAVGSASWGVLGWYMGYSSIALWSSAFAFVDLRGFWLWGKPPTTKVDQVYPYGKLS